MMRKQYSIQELSALTGVSRRTIRYYIQESLLEPPAGRGRGGFYYDSHLLKLSKIRELQNQGIQLEVIAKILKETEFKEISDRASHVVSKLEIPDRIEPSRELWIKHSISNGVHLQVRHDIDVQQKKKIDQILRLAASILDKGEGSDE